MIERSLDAIEIIIVHSSDSPFGDVDTIDGWHLERFNEVCGYHSVICNVYPTATDYRARRPCLEFDGKVEHARALDVVGVHCAGHNSRSVGVCLIGKTVFSGAQLAALRGEVKRIRGELGRFVPVTTHSMLNPKKTCPDLSWPFLHGLIDGDL